jgi:hypothetical protein
MTLRNKDAHDAKGLAPSGPALFFLFALMDSSTPGCLLLEELIDKV